MSNFVDINHTSRKESYSSKIKAIREVFNSSSSFLDSFRELQLSGVFSVPSLYSSSLAICVGSFYHGYNFLVFFDANENDFFVIVQHNHGAHGVISVGEGWVSAPKAIIKTLNSEEMVSNIKSSYNSVLSSFHKGRKIEFLGLIDGYKRPYHYFYDRLACLLALRNAFPDVKVFSFVEKSFFPSGYDSKLIPVSSPKDLNSRSIGPQGLGFFIQPFRFHDYDMEVTRGVIFSKLENSVISKSFVKLKGSDLLVVWIGLCSEKRGMENIEGIVSNFISYCLSEASSYEKRVVFLFDGLTCPFGVNEDVFKDDCIKEIELKERIKEKVGEFDYISLIGCKAEEKIRFSSCVDFFFSNALTDSIWPSFFGRAPGVAYCSENSDYSAHLHPKTRMLDSKLVFNTDDGGGNWSKESFSLSASDCSLVLEDSVRPLLANKVSNFILEPKKNGESVIHSGMVKVLSKNFRLVIDLVFTDYRYSLPSKEESKIVVDFYDNNGRRIELFTSPIKRLLDIKAPDGAAEFCLYIDLSDDVSIVKKGGFYYYPTS